MVEVTSAMVLETVSRGWVSGSVEGGYGNAEYEGMELVGGWRGKDGWVIGMSVLGGG